MGSPKRECAGFSGETGGHWWVKDLWHSASQSPVRPGRGAAGRAGNIGAPSPACRPPPGGGVAAAVGAARSPATPATPVTPGGDSGWPGVVGPSYSRASRTPVPMRSCTSLGLFFTPENYPSLDTVPVLTCSLMHD